MCNGLYASELLCAASELYFMHYMQPILRVLHDSKESARNILCAAYESVFLVWLT